MSNDKSFTTEHCAIFNVSFKSLFIHICHWLNIFFLQGTCYKNFHFRALQIHSRKSKIVREKKIPNRLVRYQRDPSKSFKDRGKVESWKYCDQTTSNLDNVSVKSLHSWGKQLISAVDLSCTTLPTCVFCFLTIFTLYGLASAICKGRRSTSGFMANNQKLWKSYCLTWYLPSLNP